MKRIYTLIIFTALTGWLVIGSVSAQENQFKEAKDSDPEAKAMLDKMLDKISNWDAVKIRFTLAYDMPDGSKMEERGSILQQDDKFRFELGDQLVVSDGTYSWLYLKNRNEVQINDLDEESSTLTPTYFLDFHQKGEYVYAITNQYNDSSGQAITRIDFKPLDSFSEYAKIGLDIRQKTYLPLGILVVLKEGGRYVFSDIDIQQAEVPVSETFVFDPAKYGGIHIEDLRLD